jgi:preprotein translocase subunit SecF
MEFFRFKRDIPFMRHVLVFNAISFITFALAVFFLATRGLNPSIEFTGGTLVEVQYAQSADINKTRSVVDAMGFGEVQVQNFGTSRDVLIRVPIRANVKQTEVSGLVFGALCKADSGTVGTKQYTTPQGEQVSRPSCAKADGSEPLQLTRSEAVGASVGAELYTNGALALAVTVLGIMAYLAVRFEWKFALAGIIANLHDVVIILGFFAFFQWEFSLAVLAAILAVLGSAPRRSSTTPSPAPPAAPSSPTAARR